MYHGFGGTLSGIAHPDDTIVYHPGITAFQALFHRLGLRLFMGRPPAHSGEALPARAIAEAPLSVAYAEPLSRPRQRAGRAQAPSRPPGAPSSPNGSAPQNASFSGRWRIWPHGMRPTSILLLLPNLWHCVLIPSPCSTCVQPDSGIRRFPYPQHPRADALPLSRRRTREHDYRLRCAGGDLSAAASA